MTFARPSPRNERYLINSLAQTPDSEWLVPRHTAEPQPLLSLPNTELALACSTREIWIIYKKLSD